MSFKILGHEPAAIVALVETFLVLLVTFGAFGLTTDQAGGIVAVVSAGLALVVAYATKRTTPSLVVGLAKAVLIATATFGFALSAEQQSAVIAFLAIGAGLFIRQTNASAETAVSTRSPGYAQI